MKEHHRSVMKYKDEKVTKKLTHLKLEHNEKTIIQPDLFAFNSYRNVSNGAGQPARRYSC